MTRSRFAALLLTAALVASPLAAAAASLSVSPVSLEIAAPGAASSLTLGNTGTEAINAQIRVYQWTQSNGADVLTPTRDVVASPPFLKLAPGLSNVVRVVRLAKTPLAHEEAYRLVVDELPKTA